jgi:hypothetical protein
LRSFLFFVHARIGDVAPTLSGPLLTFAGRWVSLSAVLPSGPFAYCDRSFFDPAKDLA